MVLSLVAAAQRAVRAIGARGQQPLRLIAAPSAPRSAALAPMRCAFLSSSAPIAASQQSTGKKLTASLAIAMGLAAAGATYLSYQPTIATESASSADDEDDDEDDEDGDDWDIKDEDVGKTNPDLPTYSKEEIKKHADKNSSVWVYYRNGVYDVTGFVEGHPGGNKILEAAGGDIAPYWRLYAQHQVPFVWETLEAMRIGNVDRADEDQTDGEDPFANDPKRDPRFKVHTERPFNAETDPVLLANTYTTPTHLHYVRNHLPVPVVDEKDYTLTVTVDDKTRTFTLDELKKIARKRSIYATMQCAGNRRKDMLYVKNVKGTPWDIGAIGNASYTGLIMRDVLEEVNPVAVAEMEAGTSPYKHVELCGLDIGPDGEAYKSSVPCSKVLSPFGDCILAYEMNNETITPDHGYPLRAIIPGHIGARSIKWLSSMKMIQDESKGFFQQQDYKLLCPSASPTKETITQATSMQESAVQCAICKTWTEDGGETLVVRGYAFAGGGRSIDRVEVTCDNETWKMCELVAADTDFNRQWGWTLFTGRFSRDELNMHNRSLDSNNQEGGSAHVNITARAVDGAGNTQPSNAADVWNLRGLGNNSLHFVTVSLGSNAKDRRK